MDDFLKRFNPLWLVHGAVGFVALAFVPTFWLGAGSMGAFSTACCLLGASCAAAWLCLLVRNTLRGR